MLIIGIAGGTGSGKTTVAKAIVDRLGSEHVALISQDAYYKEHLDLSNSERERLNYDHPDSFDSELLLTHLLKLRAGEPIWMPTYDFASHSRSSQAILIPHKPVIVLEGIHVLVESMLREFLDIKVYVDTDPDVRVLRRVMRDIQDRGRSLSSVYQQYLSTVKPMHDAFIEPSKRYADLIIPEGGENEIAISLLTTRIGQFISEFKF